jgi:hypothetical protein
VECVWVVWGGVGWGGVGWGGVGWGEVGWGGVVGGGGARARACVCVCVRARSGARVPGRADQATDPLRMRMHCAAALVMRGTAVPPLSASRAARRARAQQSPATAALRRHHRRPARPLTPTHACEQRPERGDVLQLVAANEQLALRAGVCAGRGQGAVHGCGCVLRSAGLGAGMGACMWGGHGGLVMLAHTHTHPHAQQLAHQQTRTRTSAPAWLQSLPPAPSSPASRA